MLSNTRGGDNTPCGTPQASGTAPPQGPPSSPALKEDAKPGQGRSLNPRAGEAAAQSPVGGPVASSVREKSETSIAWKWVKNKAIQT